MKIFRCSDGHISTSVDCPYCNKIRLENEEHEARMEAICEEGN